MTEHGDNLIITNFDNRTIVDENSNFVSVVRIQERYHYTTIRGGYNERFIVEGNRERLRMAVTQGLDYARKHALTVQVNNPHVKEDILNGIHDVSGLLIVDEIRNIICDNRASSP